MRPAMLVLAVLIGLAAGVGGFTFVYARGYAYLTNAPSACVNCHIMREQYDGWLASSHRRAAGATIATPRTISSASGRPRP